MKISIVVDNPRSWFVPHAHVLAERLASYGQVDLLPDANQVKAGNDVAFLLSCEKKVGKVALGQSKSNIVVHASDLPEGKGMSPLTWQILEGKNRIPLTLFEAVEEIDAGPVYLRDSVEFLGHELLDEMQEALGIKIVEMCSFYVSRWPGIFSCSIPQQGEESVYRKRSPSDSRLDPEKTIAEQFKLLRVVDNEQYPAFFEYLGCRYTLKIDKAQSAPVS